MSARAGAPRAPLPIDAVLPAIGAQLEAAPRLVVQAEPGAGKSTRIPPYLLAAPWLGQRSLLVLEPRRIAARNLAAFLAEASGEPLGGRIGLQIRGERRTSRRTRLTVVTEGMLTRRLQADPELSDVGAIVFDEFHERHLQTDLGLALALDVQASLRPDLRLVLMSATLDADRLAEWLGAAAVVSPGRRHPVTVAYRAAGERSGDARAVVAGVREALADTAGDVLVFLPGRTEIERARAALTGAAAEVRPLYGALPLAEQRTVLAPGTRRRVVLATNIAESSLTVPGITAVVDAGLERVPRYHPASGLTRLVTQRITAASAEQRAGRAGRDAPGHCYRLWSPEERLVPHREPEILSADLGALVLELAAWGCAAEDLRWLDAPPGGALARGGDLLRLLGALDSAGSLTAFGRRLLRWGTEPRLAALLERSGRACGLASRAVALLEGRDPLPEAGDDLRVRLRAWERGRLPRGARAVLDREAGRWLERAGQRGRDATPGDPERVGLVVARAYPDRLARRREGSNDRYLLANGHGVELRPGSGLAGERWLVVCDARLESGDSTVRLAAPVDERALLAELSNRLTASSVVAWDDRTGALVAEQRRQLGAIVLDRRPWPDAPAKAFTAALLEGIRRRGLRCLPWTEAARGLRDRVRCVHRHAPERAPDWSDQALLAGLESWLGPYLVGLTRFEALAALPLERVLGDALGYERRREIDRLAPRHLPVPSGRKAPVDYSDPVRPVLAVKLQELFGATRTPRILDGRLALTVHLLSPAGRPLQVTQDLAHFWANGYREVRKEMRGRYPRHPWPEDPLAATATRHAKRRPGGP